MAGSLCIIDGKDAVEGSDDPWRRTKMMPLAVLAPTTSGSNTTGRQHEPEV
jgi:hypothetical protein